MENDKCLKDVGRTLLKEISGDVVVWRTLDRTSYSAAQMLDEIELGTETGKQWISDVLRVAIDVLRREAKCGNVMKKCKLCDFFIKEGYARNICFNCMGISE